MDAAVEARLMKISAAFVREKRLVDFNESFGPSFPAYAGVDPSMAGQAVWWEVISVLTWGFVL